MKFLSLVSTVLLTSTFTSALPATLYTRQRLPKIGSGPAKATDGSTIVEDQVTVNGLPIRFKVSAPADQLVSNANAAGAQTNGNAGGNGNGALGINVLFHGDGGQSFFDFPVRRDFVV